MEQKADAVLSAKSVHANTSTLQYMCNKCTQFKREPTHISIEMPTEYLIDSEPKLHTFLFKPKTAKISRSSVTLCLSRQLQLAVIFNEAKI